MVSAARDPSTTADVRRAVDALGLPALAVEVFHRTGRLPVGPRIAVQASVDPDGVAVVDLLANETTVSLTWSAFDRAVNRFAHRLVAHGAQPRGTVAIALPNGSPHLIATLAAWRAGATVAPLDPRLPPSARSTILRTLAPDVLVASWSEAQLTPSDVASDDTPATPLAFRLADPYAVLSTGGSTQAPTLMVQPGCVWGRFDRPPDHLAQGHGIRVSQVQLVTLPFSHGFGFGYANVFGLAYGHSLVVMERFDASQALGAIERFGIQYLATVPTALVRMLRDPSFEQRDLSSLQAILHAAAPCPPAVKRAWIARLGPERVYEAYGATDVSLSCTIRGDEWLVRPGSVGQPAGAEVRILGEDGRPSRTGEVGTIHVRPIDRSSAHPQALGSAVDESQAFRSTGDRGRVDEHGYVYVCGRADRLVTTGGFGVHPESVESVLVAHPSVVDAAVVGVPDADLGQRLHAMVQLGPGGPPVVGHEDLLSWCRSRLPPESVPRSVAICQSIPRSDVGKLSHRSLRDPRLHQQGRLPARDSPAPESETERS